MMSRDRSMRTVFARLSCLLGLPCFLALTCFVAMCGGGNLLVLFAQQPSSAGRAAAPEEGRPPQPPERSQPQEQPAGRASPDNAINELGTLLATRRMACHG